MHGMARMVMCRKLGKELPGLPFKPFDDELGQRIFDEISMEAWQEWLQHSVRYINTYRLDLSDKSAQEFLRKQMSIHFGFEKGDEAQTAWTPPAK
jgi:Fe-S cluster biosynthesis and repair protein YggX